MIPRVQTIAQNLASFLTFIPLGNGSIVVVEDALTEPFGSISALERRDVADAQDRKVTVVWCDSKVEC